MRNALIIVDVQNDFLPGGSLPVPEGDLILPVLPILVERVRAEGGFVAATQDWHPEGHCSFSDWPVHCVQGSAGAAFPTLFREDLDLTDEDLFPKGEKIDADSYSGFGNPYLLPFLRTRGVQRVFVCGLALDYCVKATALDAAQAGFPTYVVLDATRPVRWDTGHAALYKLASAGVGLVYSGSLP